MPRGRTHFLYVERVATLAEEGERPAGIARRIKEEAERAGRGDYPSERTIRRLYDEHMEKPEAVRRGAGAFHWPESMQSGLLPWEASHAALELLRLRQMEGRGRPLIREAKWFWRIRSASSTVPVVQADFWAKVLAAHEFAVQTTTESATLEPSIEWMLAFEPWVSAVHAAEYERIAKQFELVEYSPYSRSARLPNDSDETRRLVDPDYPKSMEPSRAQPDDSAGENAIIVHEWANFDKGNEADSDG